MAKAYHQAEAREKEDNLEKLGNDLTVCVRDDLEDGHGFEFVGFSLNDFNLFDQSPIAYLLPSF